jgi:predicted NUDIX family phosphoesterase
MSKENELILVVPRKSIEEIGIFQGFNPNGKTYIEKLLNANEAHFTPRGPAEINPSLKQIIPYCLVIQDGKIVIYQRGNSGGENRLKSLWSCGIGGHINPVDTNEQNCPFNELSLKNALLRELQEELILPMGGVTFKTAGLINDDSNPVGEVHLGLVELAFVGPGPILPNEDAIANLELVSPETLISKIESLETWSQIVAKNLDKILS